MIWSIGHLQTVVECDGKEAEPAPLMASLGVIVASPTMEESNSTLMVSSSTPVSLFPPPGMGGVPQPPVSTKELIIIIFMFCLWAYSLFLTYRFFMRNIQTDTNLRASTSFNFFDWLQPELPSLQPGSTIKYFPYDHSWEKVGTYGPSQLSHFLIIHFLTYMCGASDLYIRFSIGRRRTTP